MPNYREIECLNCHKYFEPTCQSITQLICGDHMIGCPHCGKNFQPKADDVSWMVERIRTFEVPDNHEEPKKAEKQEAVDKFLVYIDSIPDADLMDPEVVAEIHDRFRAELTPQTGLTGDTRINGVGLFSLEY